MLPASARLLAAAAAFSAHVALVPALQFDASQPSSIASAAAALASNTLTYYTGYRPGDNPGNLPPPYYWWEAGGMFAHLIDYWYYTGDDQYNWIIRQAVTWQAGSDGAFMPANQTSDLGNDDQVFWGFTAMEAAELNFEPPLKNESVPSYISMAQTVAYKINNRWDDTACGGGLRWQTQPFKGNQYLYKNSVANGGFFALCSRLARYTGNDSYVDLATRSWDWFSQSSLFEPDTFTINDGTSMTTNCTGANPQQWSYNYTLWMTGLAFLYNHTKDAKWLPPLKGILGAFFKNFFPNNGKILSETLCEPTKNCDADNLSFKSFDMRWLVLIMQMAPELEDTIWPYFLASAEAAAAQCSGPDNACGFDWLSSTYEAPPGLGQEMSALAAVQGTMLKAKNIALPLTVASNGSSKPVAAPGSIVGDNGPKPITSGDRAGAGILTFVCVAFTLGGAGWLLFTAG